MSVVLLRVEDKGLGLLHNGVLLGGVKSEFDHHDAWFLLESVAEKLATLNSVEVKHARFAESELVQGWQWDDVVKAHYDREGISTLKLSLRHIKKDDINVLGDISAQHEDWVIIRDFGFEISREGLSKLEGFGTDALSFVINYGLMAGYQKLMLIEGGPVMADFDVY